MALLPGAVRCPRAAVETRRTRLTLWTLSDASIARLNGRLIGSRQFPRERKSAFGADA